MARIILAVKVESGAKLVEQAGSTMGEVVSMFRLDQSQGSQLVNAAPKPAVAAAQNKPKRKIPPPAASAPEDERAEF